MPIDRRSVQREQTELLLSAFEGQVQTDPPNWPDVPKGEEPGLPPRAMFRRGRLVVRDRYLNLVIRTLAARFDSDLAAFEIIRPNLFAGVSQIALPDKVDVLEALEEVEAEIGVDVAAVDHLLSITPPILPGSRCPATEPEYVPEHSRPWPPQASGSPDGAGVLVGVIDTGLFANAGADHDWLVGVTGETEPEDDGAGNIPVYTGHGTFIAGVVRCMAPRADVHVLRTFQLAGGAFETEIAMRIVELLRHGVDVISLSAGTYAYGNSGMLALRHVVETILPRHKGVVLVVSAGNDSVRDPFLPAAMANTVAVGALSNRGDDRAWFSNHGGWVDVYAPGEDLVNAFAHGCYTYQESPRKGETQEFSGMARWSGTSFSAPLVAGLIAARMSATGENGVTAAQRLVEFGQTEAIPGVGAVLRPGDALAGA